MGHPQSGYPRSPTTFGGSLTYRAIESGTYSLRFNSSFSNASGNFRLTMAQVPGIQSDPEGFELRSMQSTGRFLASGEIDVFTIQADASDNLVMTLGIDGKSDYYFTPELKLFSPTGELLDSFWSFNGASIEHTTESPGEFYVVVNSHYNANGAYRLGMAKVPSIDNDQYGTELSYGQMVAGYLENGSVNVYRIDMLTGEHVNISIKVSGGSSYYFTPHLRLYSPGGTLVDSRWSFSGTSVDYTAITSGIHYLVFSSQYGRYGTYELKVENSL